MVRFNPSTCSIINYEPTVITTELWWNAVTAVEWRHYLAEVAGRGETERVEVLVELVLV